MPHTAEGVIARQGHETADGRLFEKFEFRDTIRLRAQFVDAGMGHDGAEPVGVIDRVEIRDNGDVYAWMTFADTDEGLKAARLVENGALSGISIDGSNVWAYELSSRLVDQNSARVTDEQAAAAEAAWLVRERAKARQMVIDAGGDQDDADAAEHSVWVDWHAIMLEERWRNQTVFERAVIAAATLVAIPAFPDAEIAYTGTGFGATVVVREEVMAGAMPIFPASAFAQRNFLRATALQWSDVEIAGEPWAAVCGHVAPWDVPHEATGQVLRRDDFAVSKFLSGMLPLDDGSSVPVGQLTVANIHGRGQRGRKLTNAELLQHYERSDCAAAHLTIYLDDHGVQVAGVVAKSATPAMIEQAMACAPSLHTRRTNGVMMLYGLLSVNQQGYVIERYEDDGDTHEIAASWAGIGGADAVPQRTTADAVAKILAADAVMAGA